MIYAQLKSGRTSKVKIPGTQNTVTLRNKTTDTAVYKHIFVQEEYKFKTDLKPKFIIDAGANIGLSSIFFSNQFPDAKIISIEIEKENFTSLVKNTKNYPNIIPVNAGLWHKKAMLEIVNPNFESTGFMVRETTGNNPNAFNAISINDIITQYKSFCN